LAISSRKRLNPKLYTTAPLRAIPGVDSPHE
jgi:hypothetical protein